MSTSENLKIPLQQIIEVTNGFAKENIIGEGGFGTVYQGHSKQHGMLAIKRLNPVRGQGDHEYGMEVTLLSKYKHENLVSLIGFCGENGEKILVYKYEANQSLDKFLCSKDLSWICRLQICLSAARGLRYLHDETGSGHGVIHRDIKSSNILLDENWNAKISDFGLSKIAITNSANSVIFTIACGTYGYIDPQIHGGITQKSDVYSFGVVLYEVLFGKLVAIPGYLGDDRFTVQMAKEHYEKNTLHEMIDSCIRDQMNSNSLSTFSAIAYQCLEIDTKDRPTMSLVVEALKKALDYQQAGTRESFGLSPSEFVYDVYISFRVEEEFSRRFTSSLIEALEREGLSPYKDNTGNYYNNKSVLLTAIKQSRAFIIVFSNTFATDSWKPEEVVEIVKCVKERGNVVIPIFGDVDPSEVRDQKGIFGEAMSKYNTNPKMKVWANALAEAANVLGLEASKFQCCEDLTKTAAATIKSLLLQNINLLDHLHPVPSCGTKEHRGPSP